MNILLLTATREYSTDNGLSWHSAYYPSTDRYSDVVMFNPNNNENTVSIYPAVDAVTIDGSLKTAGFYTPATLVTAIQAVFPKANTGSGGTGTTTQNGVTYHMLTDAEYAALQAILNVNNNAL